jgi:hypothetical protein
MQLQDLSFRFALLETDLFDIESDKSKKIKMHPIALPRYNKRTDHLLFIKERLSCIHDELGLQELRPLSPKVSALLPSWCEKCSVTIDTLAKTSYFQSTEDREEIVKLASETRSKIEDIKARCGLFQKSLKEKELFEAAPPQSDGGVRNWMTTKLSGAARGLGHWLGGYFGKKADNTVVWLSKAPKEEKKLIEQEQRELRIASGGPVALSFAATFSDYLVSYLEEHVLHINEREVGLRPEFLTKFFEDPYVPHPVPTALGKAFIAALSSNREDIRKMLEVNVLIFLDNVYSKMDIAFTNSPYALTSLVHATLAETINEVEKDKALPLLDSMGLVQRNMLLSGQVTTQLVGMFLKMGFPKGAESLHIPSKTISFFGRDALWNVIEEVFTSTLRDSLIDMSEHSDIQEELLLKGYRELNDYLMGRMPEEDERRRRAGGAGHTILVEFLVTIFSSFFAALRTAFFNQGEKNQKDGNERQTLYPANEDLACQIQSGLSSLLPDTWIGKKLKQHISPRIAASMAPLLAERLREFGGKTCINEGLQRMEALLQKDFPRTQNEKEEVEKHEQEERAAQKKELEEEELKFRDNIPVLAKKVVENFGFNMIIPSEKKLRQMWGPQRWSKKIDLFFRKFINTCFEKIILALFRIIDLPKQIDQSMYRLHKSAEKIPQDAFVTFMLDWIGKRTDLVNPSSTPGQATPRTEGFPGGLGSA